VWRTPSQTVPHVFPHRLRFYFTLAIAETRSSRACVDRLKDGRSAIPLFDVSLVLKRPKKTAVLVPILSAPLMALSRSPFHPARDSVFFFFFFFFLWVGAKRVPQPFEFSFSFPSPLFFFFLIPSLNGEGSNPYAQRVATEMKVLPPSPSWRHPSLCCEGLTSPDRIS